jgi:hypothetical protein
MYAPALLINFASMRNMVLGVADRDIVTVGTEMRINCKKRGRYGNGLLGTDAVAVVSEPEDKECRVSFFKLRRLDDVTSVSFGYATSER